MKIDFDNIKIKKKIGSGGVGTTYLCEYKNKFYAIKRLKILEKDKIINYNNTIWKEIDVFNYINTLSKNLQFFFTKLYGYNITDKISHTQQRVENYILDKYLEETDKSKWVMEILMEYKGTNTIGDFIYNKKIISKELVLSFIFQIINIICILNNGGYSHTDLHTQNIMINKTSKKSFNFIFNNIRISYEGYQLSAIDYGNAISNKLSNDNRAKNFKKYNKLWNFYEITHWTLHLITGFEYVFINGMKKKNMPWFTIKNYYENILQQIFDNYNDFYNKIIKKYLKIFPKGKQLVKKLNSLLEDKKFTTFTEIRSNIKNYSIKQSFNLIMERVRFDFSLNYPKLYMKYSSTDIEVHPLLEKNKILELLLINNTNDFINYLLNEAGRL